jgi:hypothetical protein
MKQFTILFASIVGLLLFLGVFEAWSDARAEAKSASIAPIYDSTGAMLEAISPKEAEVRISPVYDATGAMLEAIDPKEVEAAIVPVYDATGAMLEAINP